jgi:hypothetical protein
LLILYKTNDIPFEYMKISSITRIKQLDGENCYKKNDIQLLFNAEILLDDINFENSEDLNSFIKNIFEIIK